MIRGNTCTIDPPSDPLALIDFDPVEADPRASRGTPPWAHPEPEIPSPPPDRAAPDAHVPSHAPAPRDHAAPTEPPDTTDPATPVHLATLPLPHSPPDLPPEIQAQLFESFLHSAEPIPALTARLNITIDQFTDWHDNPRTQRALDNLDRIAIARAKRQLTHAHAASIHALTLIAAQTHDKTESARKAATLLHRACRDQCHDGPSSAGPSCPETEAPDTDSIAPAPAPAPNHEHRPRPAAQSRIRERITSRPPESPASAPSQTHNQPHSPRPVIPEPPSPAPARYP